MNNHLASLFLILMTLKLTGLIDWSWWWVAAPIWIPAALAIIFILLLVAIKQKARK